MCVIDGNEVRGAIANQIRILFNIVQKGGGKKHVQKFWCKFHIISNVGYIYFYNYTFATPGSNGSASGAGPDEPLHCEPASLGQRERHQDHVLSLRTGDYHHHSPVILCFHNKVVSTRILRDI